MAFLFKSKKNQPGTGLPPATRNLHTSEGASSSATSAGPNGSKDQEGVSSQTPTPSSSYNNSLNSVTSTSSPENQRMRQRAESEGQTQRPQQAPGSNPPSPGTSLYPWSQRRLNFSSPQGNPFPRYGAAINSVASKEGDIYLMGGLIDGSTVKGDLWMIESSGGNLSCFPIATVSDGPGPRVGHASLLVGNAFIVFGGDTKVDETDTLDDTLYLLNTSSRQWSRSIPPGPRPSGRYGHTISILGSRIYVFGGQVEGYFFNDLVAFDLNQLQNPTNKWEFLIRNSHEGGPPSGQIPPARTNHTIVSFNDKLYLFGGTNGVQWFNDVWSYDPRPNQWSKLDCVGFIPTPREGHAAALVNDVMYIFGGRTDEGIDLGDLAAFRITSRRWYSFQNMGPAPSPRSGHSMTAFGKQIIIMAGEPSSAPRDSTELSMTYILDTGKIRYPTESQNDEKGAAAGMRKSSVDKAGQPSGRTSREAQSQPMDPRRQAGSRESMMSPTGRPAEYGPSPGPGSRLPRASIAQAPAGPPPPGQAPTPGPRGNTPQHIMNPTSKAPTKFGGAPVDTVRAMTADRDRESPGLKDSPKDPRITADSGAGSSSGHRTPTQPSRMSARAMEAGEAAPLMSGPTRQRSLRQHRQRSSMDSADESILGKHSSIDGSVESRGYRNSRTLGDEPRSPRLTAHQEALIKELEVLKGRNAWYASELALAKKAGYTPNPSSNPGLDERAADVFGDDDRPLIEAFLAMRAELAKMQATVDRQAAIASKRVAEVEHQRDVAVNEAAYARARLAAHGGSQRGTPQPDGGYQGHGEMMTDRTTDISRRLALALASQNELKSKLEVMASELDQEKRGRELAEETCEATRRRLAELEMQSNALEIESLRAELHRAEASVREESLLRAEAESTLKQLSLDKDELLKNVEDSSTRLRDLGSNLGGLREAVTASSNKATLVEKRLEEERERREGLERKLLQLRSDHEERTTELENTTRRLRDAEELAETSAKEAETHKNAFLLGLDRASSFDSDMSMRSIADQRVTALEEQVERANKLAKGSQVAADDAADKLRRAEERIAGLEAYQEQASREGLQLRRQLQAVMKEGQSHAADNRELKAQLENHHHEAGALAIQHAALKDLLGDRGSNYPDSRRSPHLESPGSRFGTPEQGRLRELEHQLSTSLKAHDDLKSSFETREQEADRAYREKLEQLENDYQSAVHYVKGTEKMLKRMKDELSRYKSQNAKMQSELDTAQKDLAQSPNEATETPASWEAERSQLQKSISDIHEQTSSSISNLESEITKLREDLAAAETDKSKSRTEYDGIQREMLASAEKTRLELEQLKHENSLLETRASDAEQKVTMLLDQVEASVGHYRRQSQPVQGLNGISRTHSNASSNTIGGGGGGRSRANSAVSQDDPFPDNRGSMALDSLANELETLRTHWESTNRNYRLSTQSDFDRTPTKESGLSDSLAEWRRRLDEDEARAGSPEKSKPRNTGEGPAAKNMI
ncbi:Negative regulator of mitotic exit [Aspergillus nanangensis]|uniref:Negative regulator of mitotic exit n=1 Tax=Aspergillus nanangensis TaxID=2582783 RepID=A0AAD4CGV7_ASPNN|nr:Negative regulator of mitotic exit [Aspergillus nanangensis]